MNLAHRLRSQGAPETGAFYWHHLPCSCSDFVPFRLVAFYYLALLTQLTTIYKSCGPLGHVSLPSQPGIGGAIDASSLN
jgi:hypothetical protein